MEVSRQISAGCKKIEFQSSEMGFSIRRAWLFLNTPEFDEE